jgi:tetratricopeptide (TPR) repeat protein
MKSLMLLTSVAGLMLVLGWDSPYERHVRTAEAAFRRGDYPAALEHYRLAARYARDPGFLAFNQAAALARLGQWQEAITAYTQALEDAQGRRRVLSLYGRGTARLALALQSDAPNKADWLAGAIADLRACLQEQPDFDDAIYHLHLAQQLLAQMQMEQRPTADASKPGQPIPKDSRSPESQTPSITKPEPPPTGLKPIRPIAEPGSEEPVPTQQYIRPGRGQLPAIPATADSPALSPADARAWIDQDWERITRARAQRAATLPAADLVKDW